MGLLGWRTSSNPKKIQQFGTTFDMLGVTLDLDNVIEGSVTVRNKTSRIEGMTATIREVLDKGCMTAHLAASIKGKLAFMDGQHFARLGVVTTRTLSLRALGSNRELPLSASLRDALMWSLDLL
eukprot:6203366-Amphidinium_carterae.1